MAGGRGMAGSGKQRHFYGWTIVGAAFVILGVLFGIQYSFPVFFLTILEEFGWSRAATWGVSSLNLMCGAISYPLIGIAIDRFGSRVAMPLGAMILAAALGLSATVTRLWQCYVLFGVLVAVSVPFVQLSIMVILTNWFVRRRGTVFGLAYSGIGAGLFAILPAAQYAILCVGWRWTFIICALLVLAVVLPVGLLVKPRPQDMGLLPDGDVPGEAGQAPTPASGRAQGSVVMDARWAETEWTLRRAMLTRQFWFLFLGNLCVGVLDEAIYQHLIPHAQAVGYSPMVAATIMSLVSALYLVGQLAGGLLSDRYGREWIITASGLASLLGIAAAALTRDPAQPFMYGTVVLYGAGLGATISAKSATWGDVFQGRHFGSITGLLAVAYSVGGAFIAWFGGYLYDLTGTYTVTFVLAMAAALAWAISIWVVAPRRIRRIGGRAARSGAAG